MQAAATRGGTARAPFLALGALLVLLYAVFFFEWSVVHADGAGNVTYYDELADAFAAGQTNLLRDPPTDLLALPDPWDPAKNARFRGDTEAVEPRRFWLHDLTLFRGKLYLEWGALPAIALIPLHWVAGHDLPLGHVVLVVEIIAALAFAAATLLLLRLARLTPPPGFVPLIALQFVLCPLWAFLLRRIAVYEMAVLFGQLCIGLAFLCIVLAFDQKLRHGRRQVWLLALGSLFLGGAVNCRPDLASLGLMVPVLLWFWLGAEGAAPILRRAAVPALALGLPAATLLGCMFLYNVLRYGDPLETGQTWQLWGGHEALWQSKFHFLALDRGLPNLFYHFLSPITVAVSQPLLIRPILVQPSSWMSPPVLAGYGGDYIGRSGGLFVVLPISMLALATPLLFRRRVADDLGSLRRIAAATMLTGLMAEALLAFAPALMRYTSEWCMWWVVTGTLIAFGIRTMLHRRGRTILARAFDLALVLSMIWSCWVGISYVAYSE